MKSVLLLILCNNVGGYMLGNMLGNIGKRKINIKMNLESPVNIVNKFANGRAGIGEPWTIQELSARVDKDNIEGVSLIVKDNVVNGLVAIDKNYNEIIDSNNLHLVRTGIPELTNRVLDILNSHNINYDIFYQPGNFDISSIFQIILNIGFAYLLLSIVGTLITGRGGGGLPGMGPNPLNNKVEVITVDTNISTKFSDVAGCDEAKYELEEIVDFLKNPSYYAEAGAKVPKGVLLEGPPGTGKTLLARAVAGEAGVSFIPATGSEFIEMFVGVGAARVRKLFDLARENKPAVIFIDEIDAIGRQRGTGVNSGNDEREQTLNQILTNMDGFGKEEGIIILGATNRVDILDSALVRSGRFDRKVKVGLPDDDGREEILKVHLRNKKISDDVDLKEISQLTVGFSGADLENLANEAIILSLRNNSTIISRDRFLDAFEKTTIGLPSNKETRDNELLELVAYHEAGHALIASLFSEFYDVRKVTITANKGGAGGYTLFTPKDRYNSYPTKKYLLSRLLVSLGGRAAEIVLYNKKRSIENDNYSDHRLFGSTEDLDITTGASNDLKQADDLARNYIKLFGSSDGSLTVQTEDNNQPFLGRSMAMSSQGISEYARSQIDMGVKELLDFAKNMAVDILRENEEALDLTANKLLKDITIDNSYLESLDISYN
jgi:cell division protease FtsH